MSDPTSPGELSETPAAPPELTLSIARQAILDEKRSVFGYELFDRSTNSAGTHTAASDAALLFNAISYADSEAMAGTKTVFFVNCTHDSLAGGHLELVSPEKVVLEVPALGPEATAEDIEARGQILADLRKRGFRFALDHGSLKKAYGSWLAMATYIKLDLMAIKPEVIEPLIKFIRANIPSATVIAEKVETEEQFKRMQGFGVKYYQGYWFAKPSLVKSTAVRPSQAIILQLINLVRQQASTAEIEDVLKKDPTLSFNLLKFINSASFGLSGQVTSFRHAVMMLGLKKLFRWAALLMTTSNAGGTPAAVGQTAVVRGRLMELLVAEALPPDEADNAFIVGVFSLLDTMLNVSMDKALESLSLPDSVTEALLNRRGVFAPFLALTEACEMADDAAFAKYTIELGLTNHQVNWSHLQALAWAENLGI